MAGYALVSDLILAAVALTGLALALVVAPVRAGSAAMALPARTAPAGPGLLVRLLHHGRHRSVGRARRSWPRLGRAVAGAVLAAVLAGTPGCAA